MVFSCTLRKPAEVKKHRTNISFINNRDIHFDILKVACDSCFPIHDIGYRVRVKLSADEDSLIRTIKKEQWMQLLQNSATDYAANALLYSLYNRDAIVLLYHICCNILTIHIVFLFIKIENKVINTIPKNKNIEGIK